MQITPRRTLPDFGAVLFCLGILLLILGTAMLLPMAIDLLAGSTDWTSFAIASGLTIGTGGMLVLSNQSPGIELGPREAFLLTVTSWLGLSAFSALPFVFSDLVTGYPDAFFEAISGLTTTGATVLSGLDTLPPGLQLWRGLLQWLGGIGIIVMAVAMLPTLRVGGMQLFHSESSDKSEKLLPSARQFAGALITVYLALTLACLLAYWLAGMTGFDAAIHAMTTLSTGGFSTHDASMGNFGEAVHVISIVFMMLGALPFVLFIRAGRGEPGALFRDTQVRVFCAVVFAVALMLTAWRYSRGATEGTATFIADLLNIVSIITTTGYASGDYQLSGGFSITVFFMLTFVGGCSGSTAGGIKIFRFQVMGAMLSTVLRRTLTPHVVHPQYFGDRRLTADDITSVIAFVFAYLTAVGLLTLALSAVGLDFTTSLSGAATSIGNVGPGLGELIGPAGNFSPLPDAAKWLLSFGMLLGRLELFTVLLLLQPYFWRP